MRIQACLNGARDPGFHPSLPLSPEEVAQDAVASVAAGAVALHVHPRDGDRRESLAPEVVAETLRALRAAVPGVPVSVSTGAWIHRDDPLRREHIHGWAALGEARPDEASVNLREADAPAVIQALLAAGVGVEAGLSSLADAGRLVALGLAPRCRRILIEIPKEEGPSLGDCMLARLEGQAPGVERQVHGFDANAWRLFDLAVARGTMTRLGLEDLDVLPDGTAAPGNAALIQAGLARAAGK